MDINKKEISEIITELNHICSTQFKKEQGIEGIKLALSNSIEEYSNKNFQLNTDKFYLYRARKTKPNNKVNFFRHTDELWAPPSYIDIGRGRCNDSNERVLYCANHPITAYAELGSKMAII